MARSPIQRREETDGFLFKFGAPPELTLYQSSSIRVGVCHTAHTRTTGEQLPRWFRVAAATTVTTRHWGSCARELLYKARPVEDRQRHTIVAYSNLTDSSDVQGSLFICFQTDGSVPNTLLIANSEVVRPWVAAAEHISQFSEEARSPFVKKYKTNIHSERHQAGG